MPHSLFAGLIIAVSLGWAGSGHAQVESDAREARAAHDSGLEAHLRGEHAQADELSPNDTALQAAIEAAILADDAVLGVTCKTVEATARRLRRPG